MLTAKFHSSTACLLLACGAAVFQASHARADNLESVAHSFRGCSLLGHAAASNAIRQIPREEYAFPLIESHLGMPKIFRGDPNDTNSVLRATKRSFELTQILKFGQSMSRQRVAAAFYFGSSSAIRSNALANSAKLFGALDPSDSNYMSILIGSDLFNRLVDETGGKPFGGYAIVAHELAHTYQFKHQLQNILMPQNGAVLGMELHADFMAGVILGRVKRKGEEDAASQNVNLPSDAATITSWFQDFEDADIPAVFEVWAGIGDCNFNHPSHHGTPDERVQAFRAGFEKGYALEPVTAQVSNPTEAAAFVDAFFKQISDEGIELVRNIIASRTTATIFECQTN